MPVSSSGFFTNLLPDLEQAGAILQDKARRLQGLDELTVEEAITTRELMKLAIAVSQLLLQPCCCCSCWFCCSQHPVPHLCDCLCRRSNMLEDFDGAAGTWCQRAAGGALLAQCSPASRLLGFTHACNPQWGITQSAANFWRQNKRRGDLKKAIRVAKRRRLSTARREQGEAEHALMRVQDVE